MQAGATKARGIKVLKMETKVVVSHLIDVELRSSLPEQYKP